MTSNDQEKCCEKRNKGHQSVNYEYTTHTIYTHTKTHSISLPPSPFNKELPWYIGSQNCLHCSLLIALCAQRTEWSQRFDPLHCVQRLK